MSNSSLVSYTKLSPNHSGKRTKSIDTITIHCMAGNLSIESCGALFASSSRQASSNYGVGSDGRIGLYVDEGNRSWCTSSNANDQRAVTIEVAKNGGAPDWPVSTQAYNALINLVADICKRNDIKKLVWSTNKSTRMNHLNGCNMTVHRDYAAKACPGDYLYNRHSAIAQAVNSRLGSTSGNTGGNTSSKPSGTTTTNYTVKITASDLNIRSGPGTNYSSKGFIKPGVYTIVAESDGTGASKWGKLKSGAGWISLDYAAKTGATSAPATEVKVGSKVTVDSGAVYGGLTTARGTKVPSFVIGKQYTVSQIATHKGEKEALLKEITSWVAVKYLNVV